MERPSETTLIRFFRGQCTPHEAELVALYLSMDLDQKFVTDCMKAAWLDEEQNFDSQISDADATAFKERFFAQTATSLQMPPLEQPVPNKTRSGIPKWVWAAAAGLILVGTSLFFYDRSHEQTGAGLAQQQDIHPGGNKAVLTLADGSAVSLLDRPAGRLALDQGMEIKKTTGGEIVYIKGLKAATGSGATNTITTPKGGQYQVTLPDGTRAWLNAASSLSYPLNFGALERRVKMTGEVYFEVAKATLPGTVKRIPFFVETASQQVQVLGTHFNINAYPDEPGIRTTLLEGSVKILPKGASPVLLRPGQLAVFNKDIKVGNADIDRELAWRNGDFVFRGETLESALRQVSRWYDVEVECPAHLGAMRFNGMISRRQPLSVIVDMIQSTKLAKATIKERRLIVTD